MLIFFGNEDTSCCAHDAHIFLSYAESTRETSLAQSFPRKLKGPPNDPPLFSCFLPSFLFSLSSLSTFPPFFLVPQRIGIRGANLGGGGPRGEVGQSGGNGGAGQKVGGRRRHGQRTLQLLHGQTDPISGNWTIYIQFFLMGRRRSCLALCCMVPSS